jgi:iron-sulfur cluster assembly protein
MLNFLVTKAAEEKILQLENKTLRVGVVFGGCAGYKYTYTLNNTITNQDIVFKQNDSTVVIDSTSASLLDGCSLDYKIDIGNESFQIINPTAKFKCGCGSSFS